MLSGIAVKRFFAVMFAVLLIQGCTSLNKFDQAVIADSATTFVGLEYSGATELNPLLGQEPVVAALSSAAFSYGYRSLMRSWLDKPECMKTMHIMTSSKFGATVNNLFVIAGASNPLPVIAGMATAIYYYYSAKPEAGVC